MFIYRVEHVESGGGPYRGVQSMFFPDHCNAQTHPTANNDMKLWEKFRNVDALWGKSNHRFGFRNLKQLKGWFNKQDREELEFNDYHVIKYRSTECGVMLGRKQIVFRIDTAIKMRIIPILEV